MLTSAGALLPLYGVFSRNTDEPELGIGEPAARVQQNPSSRRCPGTRANGCRRRRGRSRSDSGSLKASSNSISSAESQLKSNRRTRADRVDDVLNSE